MQASNIAEASSAIEAPLGSYSVTALLRSGDYTKGQVADELKVARHTLWRALSREAAKG
jgi:hypothetical protein